ncbi:Disease resistance protein RGA2 [Zea mays]|jgi:hypothetical protein|uniref:Uncharacterized protein n=2 Tax=Zea mays TaxID=4577 RepID=A0A1D6G3E3_MAIZE|nr:hypothetical protein ZEAMMB73_Zm00001d011736 [Zea mays]PWZ09443.1 Disease resistance protein RGA2 [Zea mays]
METLVTAVLADLVCRAISFTVDRCCHQQRKRCVEDTTQRLHHVLLRVQTVVEEADRRCVTNRAMLRQLQLMREGVYRGYYLLSAFKRQGPVNDTAQDREVSHHGHSSFALSQFNPAKRLCTISAWTTTRANMAPQDTTREGEAELQEVLTVLERMASDMKELVVFLSSYPPTRREPRSGHLWLENRMFGRDAEQERIINFLLEPEPAHAEYLGVLPVIGRARIGKSTLVEHVCLDERVRNHFSLIVFLAESDTKDGEQSPHLGDNAIIKHQDLGSAGKSLVVIELAGDVDESTWWRRTLPALRARRTTPVSKIIVTSRSEKIAGFGTTQALELKPLPREAYWYFFKTIAFGSTDAMDEPELESICMEMADLLNGSFVAANLFGGYLRANLCPQFWQKVLKGYRHYASMHLNLFGEHQSDSLANGRPIYMWRLPKTDAMLIAYGCYQACSAQQHDLPMTTMEEVQIGSTRPRGDFQAVAWRSNIPPYYSYLLNCGVQASSSLIRTPRRNKKLRHR